MIPSRPHGFFRGGGGGPGAIDRFGEDFQVAQQACADILEAARPEVDPAQQQEILEQQLLLAQCFRDNGYPEYPDPTVGADGRIERGGPAFAALGIDRRSEAFQDTRITCSDQLGIEGGFGPGGRGFGGGN